MNNCGWLPVKRERRVVLPEPVMEGVSWNGCEDRKEGAECMHEKAHILGQ